MAKSARKHEYHHAAVPFDPLKYVKELENVGFTREQAEVQAETFFSIVQEQLVTKQDLKELENELKQSIKELDAKTTLELEAIRRDMKETEARTTLELEAIRRDIKEVEARTSLEFGTIRRDIKELEAKTTTQSELLRRDLKLWFGGMLVTLILAVSTIVTLIPRLAGH